MDIAFRVDASIEIGTGHVMRCLTLADELRNQGASITFIVRALAGNLAALVQAKDYKVVLLPASSGDYLPLVEDVAHAKWLGVTQERDAHETVDAIGSNKPDWLIVDHYALDARWHSILRGHVENIFVIDDLADRQLDCDLLLDQTYGRQERDYNRWMVNSDCRMLLGAKYALLRPEFAKLRQEAIEKRKKNVGIKRVLITMGGMDRDNITGKVLEGLSKIIWDVSPVVDIVLGGKAPNQELVRQQAQTSPFKATVSIDVDDIADRMLKADMAIGAGGTTTWERCCLGLPTLMFIQAKNQERIAKEVEMENAAIGLGGDVNQLVDKVNQKLIILVRHPNLLQKMAKAALHIVDGDGAKRIAGFMGLIK